MRNAIMYAPTGELAAHVRPDVSIGAQYGSKVVSGIQYTAAHHDTQPANPAPCIDKDIPAIRDGIVLISRIDLDTIGGISRVEDNALTRDITTESFWQLAAHVAVHGQHTIDMMGGVTGIEALFAYLARSPKKHAKLPCDVVTDVTDLIDRHFTILDRILFEADGRLLESGRKLRRKTKKLNKASFVSMSQPQAGGPKVAVRVDDVFTNHLYVTPAGEVCDAVLAYNTSTGTVILSFARMMDGYPAHGIMQGVFGLKAGGRDVMAGSPRGKRMTLPDMERVLEYIQNS